MSYITLADLKSYLGISSEDDDVLLEALIASAQKAIDTYTNRTFEASLDESRYFDYEADVEGRILYLDEDLCSITKVITNAIDEIPQDEYVTHPRNGTPYFAIEILSSSGYNWSYVDDPQVGIEVVGKWAWSETAPEDIAHATKRLAAYFYRQKDAGVFDTTAIPDAGVIQIPQGIPRDVRLIIDMYRRVF